MKNAIFTWTVVVLMLGLAFTPTLNAGEEEMAITAAKQWLGLVDEGKYGDSWEQAAEYFKGAITKGEWANALNGVRKPLGKTLSRSVTSKQSASRLPGAPDGRYVVIQFLTSFEEKKSAVETVTPMLDKDGKWRVSGYFIK